MLGFVLKLLLFLLLARLVFAVVRGLRPARRPSAPPRVEPGTARDDAQRVRRSLDEDIVDADYEDLGGGGR